METEPLLSEMDKPRSWRDWLKGIGWGMLLLAFLAVMGLFWHREREASKLQALLAEMDRSEPGWRLDDIEAAREEVSEEKNSAPVVLDAARLLPQPWPPKDFDEAHFRSLPPTEMLSAEDFATLSRELARTRAALAMATKLADLPHGRHRISYERNPIVTRLPHLQECRNMTAVLLCESLRQNQRGDSEKALAACRAALNAARSVGDEPIFISQLVRNACVRQICQGVERTLAQGEPPSEYMAALQKWLTDEDAFPALRTALRGERALMHGLFEAVEHGGVSMDEVFRTTGCGTAPNWLENTMLSLYNMNTREDHALYLSLMSRRLQEAQLPPHEQMELETQFDQEVRALPRSAFLTHLLSPAVAKMGEGFRWKHASLRCTIAALAAERYRQSHKKWPDSLDALCPQYLASVPRDPFDGEPLRYRVLEDGVVIYSISSDRVDNKGNLDRERPNQPGVDIGIRLWDVSQRRQPPRPKPDHEQKPR